METSTQIYQNNLKNDNAIDNVECSFVADADMPPAPSVEGKLATRADATKHQGDLSRK